MRVIAEFVNHQDLNPASACAAGSKPTGDVRRVLDSLIRVVTELRHGL